MRRRLIRAINRLRWWLWEWQARLEWYDLDAVRRAYARGMRGKTIFVDRKDDDD